MDAKTRDGRRIEVDGIVLGPFLMELVDSCWVEIVGIVGGE